MVDISVVIPAKNESLAIQGVVTSVFQAFSSQDAEVIVVDDGSTDNTARLAELAGATVISHPYSKGNGAAIKTGARCAKGGVLCFMDGDGQHDPTDLKNLVEQFELGFDMVVGARDRSGQASMTRSFANGVYNKFASLVVGQSVLDLTSGMRVVKREIFLQYLDLLPNGFSYPTTITMALFRAGYSISYRPITVAKRQGDSHIKLVRDGVKFLLIIFKVGTLFSPLKIFFPLSILFFFLGVTYYLFTFFVDGRFTNMGVLLFVTSILVFLMGLLSEQITSLIYMNRGQARK